MDSRVCIRPKIVVPVELNLAAGRGSRHVSKLVEICGQAAEGLQLSVEIPVHPLWQRPVVPKVPVRREEGEIVESTVVIALLKVVPQLLQVAMGRS